MPQTPNNRFLEALDRLREADKADLRKGVSEVDGMTPEQEEASDRRGNHYLKQTIRKGKQIAIWILVGAFALLMLALLGAVFVLLWVHISSVVTDDAKVSELLGTTVSWIMVAATALLIDNRFKGGK